MIKISFKYPLIIVLAVMLSLSACNDWVNDIEQPINDVGDDNLNTPGDVEFLVTGVKNSFSVVWDETSIYAGGMSDELAFTRDIQQATYPTFEALDLAETGGTNPLVSQNNSTEAIMEELAQLRLYADTLVERIENRITFTEDEMAIKNNGLFNAYFFGAVARYIWGAYWCLEPRDGGGGVINLSPYIPATDMYADAVSRLDMAITYADESQAKLAYTMKARILLIQGNYADAKTAADMGLAQGDAGFDALYNTILNNYWYYWAGPGRTQFYASSRFFDYIEADPNEANRVMIYEIPASSIVSDSGVYYQQAKYLDMSSPLNFLSWQENELMKAEIEIRDGNNETGLDIINTIRTSYGIDALTADDVTNDYAGDYLELLYVERDKTLCFTGMRLIDQRRFDKWHLDINATWQRFPISNDERKVNPNFD